MAIIHQYLCLSHTVIRFILKNRLWGRVSITPILQVKKPRLRRQDWNSNSHNWLSSRRCDAMLLSNIAKGSSLHMQCSWPFLTSQPHGPLLPAAASWIPLRSLSLFLGMVLYWFAFCFLDILGFLLRHSPLPWPSVYPALSLIKAISELSRPLLVLHLPTQRRPSERLPCTASGPGPLYSTWKTMLSLHKWSLCGAEETDENKQVSKINIRGKCYGEYKRGVGRERGRELSGDCNFELRKTSLAWHLCKNDHCQFSSQRISKFVSLTALLIPTPRWHL